MEILNIDNIEIVIKKAVSVLTSGGIVVHPTDTCYGLAADITNPLAVKKVYYFKKRPAHKPVNIIVDSIEMFKIYGGWSPMVDNFLKDKSGRMHSFVVKKSHKVPVHLNPQFDNIGIQLPRNKISLGMLSKLGSPLVATSANISDQANVYAIPELLKQIKDKDIMPDLIIDAGPLEQRPVSRIIEIINDEEFRVLRD